MSSSPTKKKDAIQQGRRDAAKAEHRRYYTRNPQPNYASFGAPSFVDEQGRYYHYGGGSGYKGVDRLWVKLPKGVPWFSGNSSGRFRINLKRVNPHTNTLVHDDEHTIRIQGTYIENNLTRRTGYVEVSADSWLRPKNDDQSEGDAAT